MRVNTEGVKITSNQKSPAWKGRRWLRTRASGELCVLPRCFAPLYSALSNAEVLTCGKSDTVCEAYTAATMGKVQQ